MNDYESKMLEAEKKLSAYVHTFSDELLEEYLLFLKLDDVLYRVEFEVVK